MIKTNIHLTFQKSSLQNCYESIDDWEKTLMNIRKALDSILLPICGILGMLANIIVMVTLVRITRKKNLHGNHKNFDRLVIFLSLIDFWLIFFYVVDALIQVDLMTEPQFYQVRRPERQGGIFYFDLHLCFLRIFATFSIFRSYSHIFGIQQKQY